MNSDPADNSQPAASAHAADESAVARLVSRHVDVDDDGRIKELRARLDRMVQGEIVSLSPEGTEVVVVVEREAADDGDSSRHTYTVRSVTDFDGDATLDWAYLGAQQ